MQSLRDLNNRAATSLTFTENRGTNVIFDRAAGKSYNFTESTLSFNLLVGANIVEIINPSSAIVRYKINIGTAQATLNFGTLPSGVTVSQAGTIYTVYGIDSISDWEAVKQPTVTIDPAFTGTFSYSASIVYNTDTTANNEFKWTVGIYLPTAQLTSNTSLNITPSYIKGGNANLVIVWTWTDFIYEFIYRGIFTMITNAKFIWDLNKTLTTTTAMSCTATRYTDFNSYINIAGSSSSGQLGQYIDIADNKLVVSAASGYNSSRLVYNLTGLSTFANASESFYPSSGSLGTANLSRAANTNSGTWTVHYTAIPAPTNLHIETKLGPNSWQTHDDDTVSMTGYRNVKLSPGVVTGENYPYLVFCTQDSNASPHKISVYSLQPNPVYIVSEYDFRVSSANFNKMDVTNDYIAFVTTNSSVSIYNLADGTLVNSINHGSVISSITVYEDDIAISSTSDTKIYDISTGNTEITVSQGSSNGSSYLKTNGLTDLYVAVSDPGEISGSSQGVVRVYQRTTGNLQATIVNPNIETTSANDSFGSSIHINEDYCVISAPNEEDTVTTATNSGAIYVYT